MSPSLYTYRKAHSIIQASRVIQVDWWHHQTPNKLSKAVVQMDDVAMSSGQCLFSCAWWRPDGKMKLVNGWPTNPCMKEMFPSVYLMFIDVYFFCLIHDLFCYNCLNFVFSSVHPVAACCWFSSTEFHARGNCWMISSNPFYSAPF